VGDWNARNYRSAHDRTSEPLVLSSFLRAIAFVERRHADAAEPLTVLVALNILREFDVLLSHSVTEAGWTLRKRLPSPRAPLAVRLAAIAPWFAADPHEHQALAEMKHYRQLLGRQAAAARRPHGDRNAPSDRRILLRAITTYSRLAARLADGYHEPIVPVRRLTIGLNLRPLPLAEGRNTAIR